MPDAWEEHASGYVLDAATAERASQDGAFVITSFGPQPDAERAFTAIKAAMQFGLIRLRVTPETKGTIQALVDDGRIKCVRDIGTEHRELGVMAVKTKA
jgi:hypothetical protein